MARKEVGFVVTDDYKTWIEEVKNKIRNSQIKASVRINYEMLDLYWNLGVAICEKQNQAKWGDAFLKVMSNDLQKAFPGVSGFSVENLKHIRYWYNFYTNNEKWLQGVTQIESMVKSIPWGHNQRIMYKCKDIDEALFYICSNYNRNGKDACSRHCIREEDLNQIVLGELQGYINSMCDCEKVLAHLDELNVNYDEAVAHDKEIVALKQELTKCSAFKASLYQDLRDEIISKEQFTRYREEFSAKERELEQAIREQETIIRNIYENGIVVAKDLEQFREGLVIGNLDRVALVSFIDRILIYDDFRVEIVFKYRQEMEKVTGLFDVVNEKDAEPVYTMVDGLPVLELKEAV